MQEKDIQENDIQKNYIEKIILDDKAEIPISYPKTTNEQGFITKYELEYLRYKHEKI